MRLNTFVRRRARLLLYRKKWNNLLAQSFINEIEHLCCIGEAMLLPYPTFHSLANQSSTRDGWLHTSRRYLLHCYAFSFLKPCFKLIIMQNIAVKLNISKLWNIVLLFDDTVIIPNSTHKYLAFHGERKNFFLRNVK